MRAAVSTPQRVLAVWCPRWPEVKEDQAAGPEAQAFEQVVSAVEEFCPRVEVVRTGVCAIGAAGPARYFGGEESLARKITIAVGDLGFDCQTGIADGLFAALLAARAGPPGAVVAPGATAAFLAPHPVTVLARPGLADLLARLGITTLGEFAALPAPEAASRFGTQGAHAHRLARGLDPRSLVPRPPAADLSVRLEFDPPAEQSEPVVFAAKMLADQMHSRLAASGLACVRVQVQAICEDGREITRLWRHDGLLSSLAVAERVRWQLDGWRPAQREPDAGGRGAGGRGAGGRGAGGRGGGAGDPDRVAGITLLRLSPDQLVRDEGRQLGLWGDAVVSDRVARAAIRVQAMLGHGAVLRPVLAGGRSPAEQVMLVPFGDAEIAILPAGRPWPGKIPAPAPATVYPVLLPARVTDDSGATVTVTGRAQISAPPARLWLWPPAGAGRSLAVTSWAGPWPVTERWWDPASSRRRARFQLITEDEDAWLAVVQDGCWLIEASYD
jgi:protein ImuB